MRNLSRYEIIEELTRLGVSGPAECDVFFCEYMEYISRYHSPLSQPFENNLKETGKSFIRSLKRKG